MNELISNICEIVIAITAVLGVCISITTWKKNTLLEHNKTVQDFFRESFEDKDFATVFRSIDYDKNFYGPDFHDSELEAKIDKFLIRYTFCVDFVAGTHSDNINIDWLKYEIFRILINFSILRQIYIVLIMN